jgi:hypothetical protein
MAKTLVTCRTLLSVPRSLPHLRKGSCRSYHSEHHPDPQPFPPTQTAILSAALNRVPEYGFTSRALSLGARDAGYLEASTQLFPRGAYDLINFHLVIQRLALKDRVQFPTDAKLGVGEKVRVLTLERLLANKDVIHQWQAVSRAYLVFNKSFRIESNHSTGRHSVTCRCWKTSQPLSENSVPSQMKSGILQATPASTHPGIPSEHLLQPCTPAQSYS